MLHLDEFIILHALLLYQTQPLRDSSFDQQIPTSAGSNLSTRVKKGKESIEMQTFKETVYPRYNNVEDISYDRLKDAIRLDNNMTLNEIIFKVSRARPKTLIISMSLYEKFVQNNNNLTFMSSIQTRFCIEKEFVLKLIEGDSVSHALFRMKDDFISNFCIRTFTIPSNIRQILIQPGANLRQMDLSGANLSGANLRNANLIGTNLRVANLECADLSGAYLTFSDLTFSDLTFSDLTGADLRGADLTGADLTGADLTDANLAGAILPLDDHYRGSDTGNRFEPTRHTCKTAYAGSGGTAIQKGKGAGEGSIPEGRGAGESAIPEGRGAGEGAIPEGRGAGEGAIPGPENYRNQFYYREILIGPYSNLAETDLTGADLTGADLTGADLRYANLADANLINANLIGANLIGADLTGADLTGANLTGANLTGSNLTSAFLFKANLLGACLIGAALEGADLEEANLRFADLRYPFLVRIVFLKNTKRLGLDLRYADLSKVKFV